MLFSFVFPSDRLQSFGNLIYLQNSVLELPLLNASSGSPKPLRKATHPKDVQKDSRDQKGNCARADFRTAGKGPAGLVELSTRCLSRRHFIANGYSKQTSRGPTRSHQQLGDVSVLTFMCGMRPYHRGETLQTAEAPMDLAL